MGTYGIGKDEGVMEVGQAPKYRPKNRGWRDGTPLDDSVKELRELASGAQDAGYHSAASQLDHRAWQLMRGTAKNEPVEEEPKTPELDYII